MRHTQEVDMEWTPTMGTWTRARDNDGPVPVATWEIGVNFLLLTRVVCVSYAKMQTVPARAAYALGGPLPTRSGSERES